MYLIIVINNEMYRDMSESVFAQKQQHQEATTTLNKNGLSPEKPLVGNSVGSAFSSSTTFYVNSCVRVSRSSNRTGQHTCVS